MPQLVVDTTGQEIFLGMLAGVEIYLAKVGPGLAFDNIIVGLPCLVVALVVQLWNNDLIWAVTECASRHCHQINQRPNNQSAS